MNAKELLTVEQAAEFLAGTRATICTTVYGGGVAAFGGHRSAPQHANVLAMKKLCERAYRVFGQAEFERPAGWSWVSFGVRGCCRAGRGCVGWTCSRRKCANS